MTDLAIAPVFIVLAKKPDANALVGLVEHSFCMDWSDERVNMFWTGTAYSFLGQHEIDGQKSAEYNCRAMAATQPTWEVQVFDARSAECPVTIDWDSWLLATKSRDSGLKFYKRNAIFTMK